jgi:hypothetical protein
MENPMNRQPQTNENYTDSVNFSQEALRTQNSDKDQMEEKTWDGPLGEAVREAGTTQGYAQPEAEPRPEIEPKPNMEPEIQPAPERPDTGMPNPLGNPDTEPQVQPPTIIQTPVAEYDSQAEDEHTKSSEEVEEENVEHSEKGNMNDMQGYNEPKSRESEYYK